MPEAAPLWYPLTSPGSDAGVSRAHGPPATKFPERKMGTEKLRHKGVEMFVGELDVATLPKDGSCMKFTSFQGALETNVSF